MKDLVKAARALLLDLAATILYLAIYALSHNLALSVALGIVLASSQIAWRLLHRAPVDALQWVSLFLVLVSGAATLTTRSPLFVMLQPSAIYLLVGWVMLQKGWMVRYLPPRAMEYLPDLAVSFGYVWAGLMFFSAALNLAVAATCGLILWGSVMAAWGIASKLSLFVLQYGTMRIIGRRPWLLRAGTASASAA